MRDLRVGIWVDHLLSYCVSPPIWRGSCDPGGVRAVVAESLILKHQLVIVGRSRRRAPNLTSFDRVILGSRALFVSVRRIPQLAVILKPSTLFRLHRLLVDHSTRRTVLVLSDYIRAERLGQQGPAVELIAAISLRRNPETPNFGPSADCPAD